jgi:hypothetical protein
MSSIPAHLSWDIVYLFGHNREGSCSCDNASSEVSSLGLGLHQSLVVCFPLVIDMLGSSF